MKCLRLYIVWPSGRRISRNALVKSAAGALLPSGSFEMAPGSPADANRALIFAASAVE